MGGFRYPRKSGTTIYVESTLWIGEDTNWNFEEWFYEILLGQLAVQCEGGCCCGTLLQGKLLTLTGH